MKNNHRQLTFRNETCQSFLFFLISREVCGNQSCGERKEIFANYDGAIKALNKERLWLVAFVTLPELIIFCGGSLVSSSHVLSSESFNFWERSLVAICAAAHCFYDKDVRSLLEPEYFQAVIGRYNLSNHDEPGSKTASVWKIVLHPKWKFEESKNNADIAVVVLIEPDEFSNKI